jgi:ribonuclease BN (tRNA processing enzyme)
VQLNVVDGAVIVREMRPNEVNAPLGVGHSVTIRVEDVDAHCNRAEIKPGIVYRDSVVTVTAFEVIYKTPISFGFRIQTPDRVSVISGDTRPSEALVQACNGCDLLFHEVSRERFGPDGPTGPAQGHTSAEELGDVARRARPRRLVIYHYGGGLRPDVVTEIIRKAFSGEVTFARDLDMYQEPISYAQCRGRDDHH